VAYKIERPGSGLAFSTRRCGDLLLRQQCLIDQFDNKAESLLRLSPVMMCIANAHFSSVPGHRLDEQENLRNDLVEDLRWYQEESSPIVISSDLPTLQLTTLRRSQAASSNFTQLFHGSVK